MMKKTMLILLAGALALACGCAVSGQKFIDINYRAQPAEEDKGLIGVALFRDQRPNIGPGYIGARVLLDRSRETYFVEGMDLSATLTRAVKSYLAARGYDAIASDAWEPELKGLAQLKGDFDQVVTADIRVFECKAEKKGATTDMVLDIDMIFYLGHKKERSIKKMPVVLKLEKTMVGFDRDKVEIFFNNAMADVLEKLAF